MKLLWFGWFVVVVICEVRCPFGSAISCPTQTVYGPSIVSNRTAFVWHKVDVNGMYPSSPLCLDASYNIVTRRCQDGLWYPKYVSNCYSFECPKYFIGFDQDNCFYELPEEHICPDLGSTLAQHQSGMRLANSTPPVYGGSIFCTYRAESFLNVSVAAGANRIVVVLSFVKKLHLRVSFPEVLETIHGKDAIYCYSSHVDERLKINRKSVDFWKLYQSNFTDASINYSVFEVNVGVEPAEYWCLVFEIGQVRPVATENVVAYLGQRGNEYTLRVTLQEGNQDFSLIRKFCEACRLMEISSFETGFVEYVLHITAEATDDVVTQFSQLKTFIEASVGEGMEIISFKSSDFCLPQNDSLAWNLTPINSIAVDGTCLGPNGNPITRKCGGNFLYGAEWERERPCYRRVRSPEATKLLSNIISRRSVDFNSLADVVNAPHNFSSVDVALMANGFKRARPNSTLDFFRSMNKIMALDKKVLRTSQRRYNAADKILDVIDDVLVENPMPLKVVKEENLNVVTLRPFEGDEALGAALYGDNRVRQFSRNQSLGDLSLENLEAVVVVSPDLLEALTHNLSRADKEEFRIVLIMFKNDHLFLDMTSGKRAGSKIISVVIPEFGGYLLVPIDLYLRPMTRAKGVDCGFWDYGGAERGRWSISGAKFQSMFKNEMAHCSFTHLTNFALVVKGNETVTWAEARKSNSPKIYKSRLMIATMVVILLTFRWNF